MPGVNVGQAILPAAAFQAASSAWGEFSSVRSPSLGLGRRRVLSRPA